MTNKCELILQEGQFEIERSLEHSMLRSPPAEQLITTSNKQTLLKLESSFGQEDNIRRNNSNSSQNISAKNQMISTLHKQKQFSKLLIYCHSMKFANRLISLIKPGPKFSIEQFNMINDKASYYNCNLRIQKQHTKHFVQQNLEGMNFQFRWRLQFRKFKKKGMDFLQYQYSQIPLIEPDSYNLFIWEVFLTLIRIYLIICIPIIIVFSNQQLEYNNRIMIFISSAFLLLDLLIRGVTIVYDKGYPVDNRFILIKRQINFSNFVEIISIFAGIILGIKFNNGFDSSIIDNQGWIKLFLALYFLQLKNFVKFMNNLQYYYKPNKEISSIIDLVKLVGLILLIQHFCSCIWYLIPIIRIIIGMYQNQLGNLSWIRRVENEYWGIQYLESFYFMSVTMFTVGYGDVSPQNSFEKIFCICYMFLSTLQLSYSVNTIGAILTLLKEKNEIFRQKMTCINEYLKDKQISQQLQYKIREFCNFYWEQDIIQKRNEQDLIIKELPEELQFQLKLEQAKQLVKNCSFFKLNFSKSSIQYIIQRVGFTAYQPGTMIQISPQNNGVFIIERGNVEVFFNQTRLAILKDFDQFGFEEYINNQYHENIQYKTTTFTSIFCIPYSILKEAVKKNKSDFERIQMHQQQIKYHYCYICKNQKHSNQYCKLVHFVVDKEKSIKSYLLANNQDRMKIRRVYRGNKYSALLKQQLLESVSKIAQQEMEEVIESTFPELTYENLLKPLNSTQRICESPKENEIFRPHKPNNFLLETIKTSQIRTSNNHNQISITFRNMDISPFIPEPDVLKDLQLKMLNIQKYKPQQQVDLFILFKSLEIQHHICQDLTNFEVTKTYKKFDPEWNVKLIIEKLNNKYKHSDLYLETILRFSKYLFFPLEFIYLFKKEITKQQAESYQDRKIKDSDDEKSDFKQINVIRKFERRKALIFPKSFTLK